MRAQLRIAKTLAAALLAVVAQSAAARADSGFSLNLDRLDIGIYTVDVDTDSAKFNEYRDWHSGFVIPKLVVTGSDAETGRYLDFRSKWVGRRDAWYNFEYGVSGKWGLEVDYNKIPHRFGNNGKAVQTETSPGVWQIADTTQAAFQEAIENQRATNGGGSVNFDFLNGLVQPFLAAAAPIDLGLQRDRTHAIVEIGSMGRLAWTADYKHENRYGNRPYGSAFGFNNVTETAETIDYDSDDAMLMGEWKGTNAGLTFGYKYSTFKNDVDVMIWDNPFRIVDSGGGAAYLSPSGSSIDGSSRALADLAPENEAGWLFANGKARAGSWNFAAALTYGKMKQDDPLQAYTINSSIEGESFSGTPFEADSVGNLPRRNADNEVDVLNFTASANSRLGEAFDLGFRVRYYDYDNKSARISFPGYVRYDAVWEEIPRITVPYSYTTESYSAELGWSFGTHSRLGLSYTLESWDRKFREIENSDEDIIKLTYDTKVGIVDLRAAYEIGDRTIGEYLTEAQEDSFIVPEGINNQPGLRKYDEAARDYDMFYVQATMMIGDSSDLMLGVNSRKDDYGESEFGLLSDEILQYNAEYSVSLGGGGNFFIFYNRSEREVFQRARQSGGSLSFRDIDTWQVKFNEDNDTAGLGWNRTAGKWDVGISGTWNRSDGAGDFFTLPGGSPSSAEDISDYEDIEILSAKVKVDYKLTEHLSAGLDYRYEDYQLSSFISRNLQFYLPGALLLNANNGDYTAHVIGLRFKMSL